MMKLHILQADVIVGLLHEAVLEAAYRPQLLDFSINLLNFWGKSSIETRFYNFYYTALLIWQIPSGLSKFFTPK